MRICLASIHPRLLSGQVDALVGLARVLRERGHRVQVVSVFAESDLLDPWRAMGRSATPGALISRLLRLEGLWRELARASQTVDLVHVNLPTPGFSVLGDVLKRRCRAPVVVGFEAHLATPADVFRHRRWAAAPLFYLPLLLVNNQLVAKMSRFQADRYIVASALQQTELRQLGVPLARLACIPNLFDRSRLVKRPDPAVDALPNDGPIISYVGHFNHVKGVDVLIRALPLLREAHRSVRLVIAWSGLGPIDEIAMLVERSGLSERIHLLGRVSVASLLARTAVFALPNRLTIGQAAFPGLVLEAMATGVPLVTTDLPLLRELVAPEALALLATPEDPVDLATQIGQLLRSDGAGEAMIARQRTAVAERFAPEVLGPRYERLYEEVIGQRPLADRSTGSPEPGPVRQGGADETVD